jgi:hypothetical protein
MNGFYRWALLAAAGILPATQAYAAPIFEMRVRSGSYDTGIISGTIDPGQTSGSIHLLDLAASGGGGNAFDVEALDADFSFSASARNAPSCHSRRKWDCYPA